MLITSDAVAHGWDTSSFGSIIIVVIFIIIREREREENRKMDGRGTNATARLRLEREELSRAWIMVLTIAGRCYKHLKCKKHILILKRGGATYDQAPNSLMTLLMKNKTKHAFWRYVADWQGSTCSFLSLLSTDPCS